MGGHLLDAKLAAPPPADCVTTVPVTVEPYGMFFNLDERFWFPLPPA